MSPWLLLALTVGLALVANTALAAHTKWQRRTRRTTTPKGTP